jgi:hypothetical protein
MKRINIYIAILLLTVMSSCAVTDIDRSADFYNYRTYAWGEPTAKVNNPVYNSELISKNIKNAIGQEFAKRGIKFNPENPDFVVSYQTFTEEKREVRNRGPYGYGPYFPLRFYPYYFGWGWGFPYAWGGGFPEETNYTEGTLIIDITDNKTNELVWRGTVKGNVENISSLQKQIQKGIKAIMKKYPVTPQEPLPLMKDEKVIS